MINRLRQEKSPRTIVETTTTTKGNISTLITPSLHATNRSLLPPTQSPLEFQLVAQHPNVYPSLAPLDVASIDLQLLGIRPLGSFGKGSREQSHPYSFPDTSLSINPQALVNSEASKFNKISVNLIDDRLRNINISHWTDVAISNQFAAESFSLYLEMNQP